MAYMSQYSVYFVSQYSVYYMSQYNVYFIELCAAQLENCSACKYVAVF